MKKTEAPSDRRKIRESGNNPVDQLSHVDSQGRARMVDVGGKANNLRIALATGHIRLNKETISLIRENRIIKGSVLTVAEIAGIQAAKQTASLIPLCHNIGLTKVSVKAELTGSGVMVHSEIGCIGPTGVEMEALTAVTVALLTVYDMCKAVDKEMVLQDIKLISKEKYEIPG
jgi:cyclic pyranopterin phosphate synthase